MPEVKKTVALVNGTGRQAASVIRTITALGYAVRAQVHSLEGLVAGELAELPNVTLMEGPLLDNPVLIDALFEGVHLAFINTFPQAGDEVRIGKALANAAKKHNVQHYVYSSMPDHSVHNPNWPALPMWASKFTVENYIRQLNLPATYVYAGIYTNNFTSLPYPLFQIEFKDDDTIEWRAPFHPDTKLPWLDAEHDVGPAVLQIFKDGPKRWNGHRIALAFENLTPIQVTAAFSRALSRPCNYVFSEHIDIKVPIPNGYKQQLAGIEVLFGKYNAPYFPGVEFDFAGAGGGGGGGNTNGEKRQGSGDTITAKNVGTGMGTRRKSSEAGKGMDGGGGGGGGVAGGKKGGMGPKRRLTQEARELWGGYRGIEEYAREAFPVEEEANGKTWMIDKTVST